MPMLVGERTENTKYFHTRRWFLEGIFLDHCTTFLRIVPTILKCHSKALVGAEEKVHVEDGKKDDYLIALYELCLGVSQNKNMI